VALDQIAAVYEVLRELGIDEKGSLLALNKIDRVDDPARIEAIRNRYPQAVPISAKSGAGLSRLANAVSDALSHDFLDLEIQCDSSDGRLLSFLAKYGEVLSRTFVGHRATIHCRIARTHLGRLREDPAVEVRPFAAPGIVPSAASHLEDDAVGEVA
jgi:GTP-binding protein HflX